uniref:Sugar phosphate isomerase/epimerase n=1 Tax=Roseihalotalea indica TaxID=2867963 RepID=A0AA49GRM8_9BACT|nr:sugar phosphate isomerase/epimerase [Tunicatimonas sp. TK19036]
MNNHLSRRHLLKSVSGIPLLAFSVSAFGRGISTQTNPLAFQLSLNAYSFNDPLRNGSMSLEDLLAFTADHAFPALDLTAYYFPTYPKVPDDAYLYRIKREAHRKGVVFSGTGVRNNFTQPDPQKRQADRELVYQWIDAAVKLGAPVVRIFAGPAIPEDQSWDETAAWALDDIRQCVEYGKQRGIIVALQNHNEFITTATQVKHFMKAVDSEWFGLMLDIGSYRTADPYDEISQTASYAVNWQIKEDVYVREKETEPDLMKLLSILHLSGYRGYANLETLGPSDPYQKVPDFLAKVRTAMTDYTAGLSRENSLPQSNE